MTTKSTAKTVKENENTAVTTQQEIEKKPVDNNQHKGKETSNNVANFPRNTNRNQWLKFENTFGVISSVRDIPGSFPRVVSATISVPQGNGWEIFQFKVKEAEAVAMFDAYKFAIDGKDDKVTIRFDVTNVRPDYFYDNSDEEKPEVIVPCLKCTLTALNIMSVNRVLVYNPSQQFALRPDDYFDQLAEKQQ